jgi:hypothetical protein
MSGTATEHSGSGNTGKPENAGRSVKRAGRAAAGKADSPLLQAFGQIGVAAIGVVYLLLAWICLQVAFGGSSKSADNTGALNEIAEKPFGRILLGVMAFGLFAYAVWQIVLAVVGYQQEDGKKRLFKRISAGGKAVFGAAIGVQALKLTLGGGSKDSSQKQADWTGKLLGVPAGHVLVVIIGLALIGFAGYLAYEGFKKKFLDKLDEGVGRTITRLGQVGWIARGVAFGVLGILVVVAGVKSQPEKARGLDRALKTLADQPFGKWILTAVALGLAAYAVFQLVTASKHKEG